MDTWLTLDELAAGFGLTREAMHNRLISLKQLGYLKRDSEGNFVLGSRLSLN